MRKKGATVTYADPHVPVLRLADGSSLHAVEAAGAAREADCVVLVTAHADVDHAALVADASLVFDTRNALEPAAHVHRL